MTALPNLLIIGAQKCGTTWLHQQLSRHPDIFMARAKELHFFTKPAENRNKDEYAAHFAGAAGHKFIGESTPGYFWTYERDSPYCRINPRLMNTQIPESVLQTLGKDVKLIVLLRNPVHRAVSAYLHHYRMGRLAYNESLLDIGARSGIIDMGFYKRHLRRWEECFGVGNILVLFFDDLVRDSAEVLRSSFTYLGLPIVDVPGADDRVHAGFDLIIKKQSLRVSKNERHTKKLLTKKDLLSSPLPRIKLSDLVEVHKIYAEDIAYIEDRFPSAKLNWSATPRLEDFVNTSPNDVSRPEGERTVPISVAGAPSAELYDKGPTVQEVEGTNRDSESKYRENESTDRDNESTNRDKESINPGYFVVNRPEKLPDERTVVVCGLARGGTSFVASTLHHLGIPFDRPPPNFDNHDIAGALKAGDSSELQRQIAPFNAKYAVWGTKMVGPAKNLASALACMRNPLIILIFKDACAVSLRKVQVGRNSDAIKGIAASIRHYQVLVKALVDLPYPMMFASYDAARDSMSGFVAELSQFCGLPAVPGPEVEQIVSRVEANHSKYRRAKQRFGTFRVANA